MKRLPSLQLLGRILFGLAILQYFAPSVAKFAEIYVDNGRVFWIDKNEYNLTKFSTLGYSITINPLNLYRDATNCCGIYWPNIKGKSRRRYFNSFGINPFGRSTVDFSASPELIRGWKPYGMIIN